MQTRSNSAEREEHLINSGSVLHSKAQEGFWSRNSYPQFYPQGTVPTVPFNDLAAPAENVSR